MDTTTKVPVIYLDHEELIAFASGHEAEVRGLSYAWEGEEVVHIHLKPLLHAFGEVRPVLFCREEVAAPDCAYRVVVEGESVRLYEADGDGGWTERAYELIPSKADLYSRNKGLLELNILEHKRVLIIGLGSFGSQIAIELAKAGVGEFALMDFDRVELHNLARHTCTARELGRLKTDAIYDAIVGKNPYAKVDKFPININENLPLLYREIERADLVICATDNNLSRFNLSEALVKLKKVAIFGRAITRAEGGDVFRYIPGGPCYSCMIGSNWYNQGAEEVTDLASARRSGRIAAYVSDQDAEAIVQVGLSSDIEPICNMMVKLSLIELSRGSNSGIKSLEEELVYPCYLWANRRERHYANWFPMPSAGNKPTIMRWYGVRLERDEHCALCSEGEVELDLGEDFQAEFELPEELNGFTDGAVATVPEE